MAGDRASLRKRTGIVVDPGPNAVRCTARTDKTAGYGALSGGSPRAPGRFAGRLAPFGLGRVVDRVPYKRNNARYLPQAGTFLSATRPPSGSLFPCSSPAQSYSSFLRFLLPSPSSSASPFCAPTAA